MFKQEKKLIEELIKDRNILFFIIVSVFAFLIRLVGFEYLTGDMYYSFMVWFESIKQGGGFAALSAPVGDYSILFQTLIALLTYIPGIRSLYLLKLTFVIFDFVLAYLAAALFCEMTGQKKFELTFNVLYALVLFLPTVVINAAYWGQCDSIYTSFILLALLYLYKEKYKRAFFFLGVAFAFKFQTIFIMPFVVCLYVQKRSFSILHFAITGVTVWLSGIMSYINGGNLLSITHTYSDQTEMFQSMWMNFQSFWIILGNDYASFGTMAVLTTLIVCGLGLYLIISDKKRMDTPETYLNTAVWFMWAMLLFLPAMHERYAYLLDVLLIVLSFINVRYIKFAAVSTISSLLAYSAFLFSKTNVMNEAFAIIYTAVWLYYTYFIVKNDAKDKVA